MTFESWIEGKGKDFFSQGPRGLTNGELTIARAAWEASEKESTQEFLLFGNVFEGVVRPWVCALPKMQQTVLLCALRGPDGTPKITDAKVVVKMLRYTVLHNARPLTESDFMLADEKSEAERFMYYTGRFLGDMDAYPWHFMAHLMHAVEIVGYKHPDEVIKGRWFNFYALFAQALHLNIETRAELERRLNV